MTVYSDNSISNINYPVRIICAMSNSHEYVDDEWHYVFTVNPSEIS